MELILLQVTEATGLFSEIAQLGIVFALLVAIVFVLGRRVVKLENENKQLYISQLELVTEHTVILKEATEAIKKFNENNK